MKLPMNLAFIIGALLVPVMPSAQSIAPPVAEYRSSSKLDGVLEIQNNADYPMAAILELHSFHVDGKGHVAYGPMDADIHVEMGSNSFIIRPHDSHTVFYKATYSKVPTSFSIMVIMTKAGAAPGMRIKFVLPHMIYVYQKEKFRKGDVKLSLSEGVLHIQNLSNKLGRIESVSTPKQEFGGFPLYPSQTRDLAVDGDRASIQFEDGFKVDVKK